MILELPNTNIAAAILGFSALLILVIFKLLGKKYPK
jgi:hypothetical protein